MTEPPRAAYSPEPEPRATWVVDPPSGPRGAPDGWDAEERGISARLPNQTTDRGPGLGLIVVVALLSASLASAGTLALLGPLRGTMTAPSPPPSIGSRPAAAPALASDSDTTIVAIASKGGPSVVRISTDGIDPASPNPNASGTIGAGIIFDAAGWILTARHVVAGARSIKVDLADGTSYPATIYGLDTLTDLAIIRVAATGLPVATIGDSDQLPVGALVVAVGSSDGAYTESVSAGIVSALGRTIPGDPGLIGNLNDLIQTDAAIHSGNSGGPLLDAGGAVVGITTAAAPGSTGIGFSIPINLARPMIRQALAGAPLVRPYLGIRYTVLDPAIATTNHLPVSVGDWVHPFDPTIATEPSVVAGGPAATGGVKDGDIVTELDGTPIDALHPLEILLSQHAPGDVVTLTILRARSTLHLSVTLGTRPANF